MSISELRRLSLPRLNRGQISRPRLIERLTGRFDRRATLIVAGPGFGKSTLLAQAIQENTLAPHGTDHFLSCTPADRDVDVLVRAIANAAELELHGGPSVAGLISAVGTLPLGTCLVFDDVHEIAFESPGHAALVELVEALPLQCSLLIGSRVDPQLPTSRWLAQGLVDVLTEADLAFTPTEAQQLGATTTSWGDDANLETPYGGWPALVELARVTGGTGGDRFLREVVLRGMSEPDRYRVAVLDLIGGGDHELLGACLGEHLDAESFARLERFPMMQRSHGGGLRPHGLWQPVLTDLVAEHERPALLTMAAEHLMSRGLHDDAMRLFARCEDWDGVASVIADACSTGCTQVDNETLDRWRSALPEVERQRPEAKLVRGIAARQHQTFAEGTAELLADAAASFRERGQVGAEVAALAELAFVAREQGDAVRIITVLGRLFELDASGVAQVRAFAHLARAVIADAQDDDVALLDHLSHIGTGELSSNWASRVAWLRGHAKVMLRRPWTTRNWP